jgi:NRPS condensation-like uncharacterized protein
MTEPLETDNTESTKRLNLNLPSDRYSRVQSLAKKRGTTITDLVRFALSLMERIDTEEDFGNRIAVIDSSNQIVKELVLPL